MIYAEFRNKRFNVIEEILNEVAINKVNDLFSYRKNTIFFKSCWN